MQYNLLFMAKEKSNIGLNVLFGITFLSPVTYSILAYEMDVIQRMFFFSISLLLLLVFILKYKNSKAIALNRFLLLLMILFPFSFLTSFVNDSAFLLPLKLTDIIIPLTILLQSAMLFVMLGEDKFFKVVSYSIVIIATLFSIVGLFEVFQITILPLPSVMPPGSTLGHRGFAAEYLLSAIPFFLIATEYLSENKKNLLLAAAIINVSFLLFTRSRAGIVILLLAVFAYFIFIFIKKEKSDRFKSAKPVLIVLVISFLISLIPVKVGERPDFKSTAASFFDEDFKSNVLRLNFWDASFQMIKEKPLTGIGLYKWSGSYPKYHGEYFDDKNLFMVHNIHAHNDFLETFAESGFFSFLVFLLIYFTIVLTLFNKTNKNKKYFPLLLTILITFAFSFVSFPNYKFASHFLAAVVGGVAFVSLSDNLNNTITIRLNVFKWILFTALLICGTVSYIKLQSELNYGKALYLKDRKQAILMLQKLEEVSEIFYPFDASKQPVDHYRGIANTYLGRHSEALKNNLSANELAPFNPLVWRNIAGSYQALGNSKSAIEQFEKIQNQFPNYINAQIILLELYIESGQKEKAASLYKDLVKKTPSNPKLLKYKNQINE